MPHLHLGFVMFFSDEYSMKRFLIPAYLCLIMAILSFIIFSYLVINNNPQAELATKLAIAFVGSTVTILGYCQFKSKPIKKN